MKKTLKTIAFTLIELLFVIAIIMILASLLMPALSKAKNKSRDIYCVGNCKQIAVGISSYSGDFNGYGPADQWRAHVRSSWEYSHLSYCWSGGNCFIGYCFIRMNYFVPKVLECPIRTSVGGCNGVHTPESFYSSNYGLSGKTFNSSYEIKGSGTTIPNTAWETTMSKDYPWRVGQKPGEPMVWERVYWSYNDFVHWNGAALAYEDGSGLFAPVKKQTIIKYASYDLGKAEAKMSWIKNDICRGGNLLK